MRNGLILSCLFLFAGQADSRIRMLSLDMAPDVLSAHHWLDFERRAFEKEWLTKEIACHFNEDNECKNLAALLRMFAEVEPDKSKLIQFAEVIRDKLSWPEYSHQELAYFLYLYADDDRWVHLLDADELAETIDWMTEDERDLQDYLKALKSSSEHVVEKEFQYLIDYPNIEVLMPGAFEQLVAISENKAFDDARYLADKYLSMIGFLATYQDRQYEGGLDRITVTSGQIDPIRSLAYEPMTSIWKHHAKSFDSGDLFYFMNKVIANNDDKQRDKKIKYIRRLKVYKEAHPSQKFMMAERMKKKSIDAWLSVMKEAYKEGNPAMKSAIVAKYPKNFKKKNGFWETLKEQGSDAELVLIERNYQFWKH